MPAPDGGEWRDSETWLSRARRLGPLRYSDLGPRRLHPLGAGLIPPLAAWLGAFADGCWEEAGRPDPFTLVVVSGDDGSLASATLHRDLTCGPALRYVLVDPDRTEGAPPALSRTIALENPAFLYPMAPLEEGDDSDGPEGAGSDPDGRVPARGVGPLATFLTEVPSLGDSDGALVAVEVLSRLPYDRLEWADGNWFEIRLAASGHSVADLAVPASGRGLRPGPVGRNMVYLKQTGATEWLRRILPTGRGSVLAVVDTWSGPAEPLDLEQMRQVREPLVATPEAVAGTPLAVVTWRLG